MLRSLNTVYSNKQLLKKKIMQLRQVYSLHVSLAAGEENNVIECGQYQGRKNSTG